MRLQELYFEASPLRRIFLRTRTRIAGVPPPSSWGGSDEVVDPAQSEAIGRALQPGSLHGRRRTRIFPRHRISGSAIFFFFSSRMTPLVTAPQSGASSDAHHQAGQAL
jgi:hypothetical protein